MKQSKLIPSLLMGLATSLIANDDILSPLKKDILNYSYEKAKEDSSKLKKDWINPITYKYIYNKDNDSYKTQKSFISINQPIFKSGGIYSAIKYANAIESYSSTSVDVQKKELVKQALNLLFQIHKIDVSIQKQKLLIQNAKLDIIRKKEQVLNGILDTSFLDNAILDSNAKRNSLIDLEYQKKTLINNFSNISNKPFDKFELPKFTLKKKDDFLKENIYIKQSKEDIQSSYWLKNMTTSQYLPTVNFTADYTKYHETDNPQLKQFDDVQNIGFNITIPLDVKFSNNIESSKISYLQKKLSLESKKIEESNIYKNVASKIDSLNKKVQIAKDDVKLYDSLLTQMQEQLSVGMKTQSDVQTMQNSKSIKALEIKSLELDKQIELLEVYARVSND